VYNHDPSHTYQGVINVAHTELKMFKRLPRWPHIIWIEHYFSDRIPTASYPPNWDANPLVVAPHALFIVMGQCHISLQDVISHRKTTLTSKSVPLFSAEELLMVARDFTSALCLLPKELVAHRDIKPDNILIRLPADVTRKSVMDNLCQPRQCQPCLQQVPHVVVLCQRVHLNS
jgi:serine/threonine protein kinase